MTRSRDRVASFAQLRVQSRSSPGTWCAAERVHDRRRAANTSSTPSTIWRSCPSIGVPGGGGGWRLTVTRRKRRCATLPRSLAVRVRRRAGAASVPTLRPDPPPAPCMASTRSPHASSCGRVDRAIISPAPAPDARARELLARAKARAARSRPRQRPLAELAGTDRHQGVSRWSRRSGAVTLDEVLDALAEPALLLVLDASPIRTISAPACAAPTLSARTRSSFRRIARSASTRRSPRPRAARPTRCRSSPSPSRPALREMKDAGSGSSARMRRRKACSTRTSLARSHGSWRRGRRLRRLTRELCDRIVASRFSAASRASTSRWPPASACTPRGNDGA